MRREFIRATPAWRKKHPRYDCIFVSNGKDQPGILGMDIARVRSLISFRYDGRRYECALVHWYTRIGNAPDEDTGMWIVRPTFLRGRRPSLAVIHVESIFRAAHLIGVTKGQRIDLVDLEYHRSLDVFNRFYVNKYIDHHAFELLHT